MLLACLPIPASKIYYVGLSVPNVTECGGCGRALDEALFVGICALIDPKWLAGPPPCEGTGQVSVTGKLALPSILASIAVSRDALGGEPISILHYGGSNGQRLLSLASVPKRPAQACK